ncbi:MAG: PepSY-associated TM helix domain-containing protein [Phycisphaeraceae bacterium]
MTQTTEKKRPKNWLLIKIREWHTYVGVALSLFIVMVCLTGIYLNHKDLFKGEDKPKPMAGKEKPGKDKPKAGVATTQAPTTEADPAALNAAVDKAIAAVATQLGDLPMERIEIKDEYGHWNASVKLADVSIDPDSGKVVPKAHEHEDEEHRTFTAAMLGQLNITPAAALKLAQEKLGDAAIEKLEIKDEHGQIVFKAMTHDHDEAIVPLMQKAASEAGLLKPTVLGKYDKPMHAGGGVNWGKLLKDLHTGQIAGWLGKLFIDFTSFVIVVLTATGVWLWWVPRQRKKKAAAQAAEVAAARAASPNAA